MDGGIFSSLIPCEGTEIEYEGTELEEMRKRELDISDGFCLVCDAVETLGGCFDQRPR